MEGKEDKPTITVNTVEDEESVKSFEIQKDNEDNDTLTTPLATGTTLYVPLDRYNKDYSLDVHNEDHRGF